MLSSLYVLSSSFTFNRDPPTVNTNLAVLPGIPAPNSVLPEILWPLVFPAFRRIPSGIANSEQILFQRASSDLICPPSIQTYSNSFNTALHKTVFPDFVGPVSETITPGWSIAFTSAFSIPRWARSTYVTDGWLPGVKISSNSSDTTFEAPVTVPAALHFAARQVQQNIGPARNRSGLRLGHTCGQIEPGSGQNRGRGEPGCGQSRGVGEPGSG